MTVYDNYSIVARYALCFSDILSYSYAIYQDLSGEQAHVLYGYLIASHYLQFVCRFYTIKLDVEQSFTASSNLLHGKAPRKFGPNCGFLEM